MSETGPAIPAAAQEQTEAGAEAFVEFFIEQSALAWTTPDATLITGLSTSECKSCSGLAETAGRLAAAGERYEKAPVTVDTVEALTGDDTRMNVAASGKQHAVSVLDAQGKAVRADGAADFERTFLLFWTEGKWVVGGIA